MKKALIFENRIVDVCDVEFEVNSSFSWIDCPDECKAHNWVLENGIPVAPPPQPEITWDHKRRTAYPSYREQFDMQYHDELNGTTTWKDAVAKVKADNPKPE